MNRFEVKLDGLLGKSQTDKEVADLLGVNPGLISKYRHTGYMAPVIRHGLMAQFEDLRPPERHRFEVRFRDSAHQLAFEDLAYHSGFDTPQDFIRWLADNADKIWLT